MSQKSKGCDAERSLMHELWANGWACVRIAGSGSSRYPNPDLLAANKIRRLAIECKTTKACAKYLLEEDFLQLMQFAKAFGAEPWFAIKLGSKPWAFMSPEDLEKKGSSYKISQELIQAKGLLIEELLQ